MEQPDFDTFWNYSDPKGTRTKFEEVFDESKIDEDPQYYLQLVTQIARTHGLEMEFNNAHALLDKFEDRIMVSSPLVRIRYFLERGRTYNSSGEKEQAFDLFEKAWELGKEHGIDGYAVDAAHMLAIAEQNPEKQLQWNMTAIQYAEKSSEEKAQNWLGSLYNNTGWTYHDKGEYETALDLFERALEFRKRTPEKKVNIQIAKWCIGRTYRSLERYKEAKEVMHGLEREYEADGTGDGYVFEELGELYLNSDADKAKPYFAKAHELLSQDKWMQKNEGDRLQRLKELSE